MQGRPFRFHSVAAASLALVIALAIPAFAQSPGINLAQLAAEVNTLQQQVQAQQTTINNQAAVIQALQAKTAPISVQNGVGSNTELYFTGVNVHIVNGQGSTGSVNGLGNLIIGYDASRMLYGGADIRTGSHNLILGDQNNYSSYGGLLGGLFNSITAPYASIVAGESNTASGVGAGVLAGNVNTAADYFTAILGGTFNTVYGPNSTISGGASNSTTAGIAAIAGGEYNSASALGAVAVGGSHNTASGLTSVVVGGYGNDSGSYNSIAP